ncbi:hypothetical protein F511_29148 [Dorcoceras hygrometricum]|uniref:Uncharacterized protein n=1 Tax=Dorcoceras hygrometricum TaxID=472368 RepID=A0A2Z7AL52_9LAMI|nr:hypothetical protein F511_29148 [Dorcoceras hygrometricum]
MIKATFKEGIDSPIDISICDKQIETLDPCPKSSSQPFASGIEEEEINLRPQTDKGKINVTTNEIASSPFQSTRSVLGKWVYLVTLAMSLFDLQDVCIVIESMATLDLPMVVDLIGIYVLKGPYCTLTTTNWFFQALSVIPRGSWGDVARRFTMIRWASPKL